MNSIQFSEAVKAKFLSVFPNGYFRTSPLPLGGDLCITMALTGDLQDVTSRIRENDVMRIVLAFHGVKHNSVDDISEKIDMEPYYSRISTIPPSKYYAMGCEKIKTRKTNNTLEKLVGTISKYIDNAGNQVHTLAGKNELYNQYNINPKYLDIICK